jgi:hypothetical protein
MEIVVSNAAEDPGIFVAGNFHRLFLNPSKMSVRKSSKQKNTRHHINTAPGIAKKQSKKTKQRNTNLRDQLDKVTGLAGAANLFAPPSKPKKKFQMEQAQRVEIDKKVEEDMIALMSMKLSSTATH